MLHIFMINLIFLGLMSFGLSRKLKFVAEYSRHGARGPKMILDYNKDYWT